MLQLALAVVAGLSPPSSIDIDVFNMTTLDDIDLSTFRVFLTLTHRIHLLKTIFI